MDKQTVIAAAANRRERRWEKEAAAQAEVEAHFDLAKMIAAWKSVSPNGVKFSNIFCRAAPADLGCVFIDSADPYTNKCLFCQGREADFL